LIHMQRAGEMAVGRLLDFCLAIDGAPGAHDALDMLRA
jgi:hypothetical protein